MLEYTPELLVRPLLADREREAAALALAFAASGRAPGLRAAVAGGLARLAVALHHDAATAAALPSESTSTGQA